MTHSNDPKFDGEQIIDLVQSNQDGTTELNDGEMDQVRGGTEMANETYVNRVRTSDKHQAAVSAFIKG